MRESPSRSNETTTLTTQAIEIGASMASTIVATDAAFPILNAKSATEGPHIASMSPRSGGMTSARLCADSESWVMKACLGSKYHRTGEG